MPRFCMQIVRGDDPICVPFRQAAFRSRAHLTFDLGINESNFVNALSLKYKLTRTDKDKCRAISFGAF